MTEETTIWQDLKAYKKAKFDADRARFLADAQAADDGGWTKHTQWHWSRMVNGERLDYWPSRKKYQYRGKVKRGDVMRIVKPHMREVQRLQAEIAELEFLLTALPETAILQRMELGAKLKGKTVKLAHITSKCRHCRTPMQPGLAIEQTYTGKPEFAGSEIVTLSPGGPGKLIDCLKCPKCGWSVKEQK